MTKHNEELLEELYWEFNSQRKKSGEERILFKSKLRHYADVLSAGERLNPWIPKTRKQRLEELKLKAGLSCNKCKRGNYYIDTNGYSDFLRCSCCGNVPLD